MKTSRNLALAAALAASLILTGTAIVLAQPPAGPGGPAGGRGGFNPDQMFDRMDANKDGKVTKEEFIEGFGRRRGERPGDTAGRPDQNPMERVRQGVLDRLKEELGSNDQEWTLLKPRIEKVMELNRAQRPGGFRGGEEQDTPAEVAALRKAVEDEKTPADELKKKLEAVRELQKKQAAELETARAALRELVTARQEAVLVLAGLLN